MSDVASDIKCDMGNSHSRGHQSQGEKKKGKDGIMNKNDEWSKISFIQVDLMTNTKWIYGGQYIIGKPAEVDFFMSVIH